MESLFFYIFASITVGMVLLMIFQTNPVASALYLVFAFFGLAGLYVLLSASFVAVLQVLVYAGAIMVLFVFVIMLLNLKKEDLIDDKIGKKHVLVVILGMLFAGFFIKYFLSIPVVPFEEVPANFGEVAEVGKLLFTKYLIPFELTSILLLVGIIGAVVLGKKEIE